MIHFFFIQSVAAREYEVGKVLYDHLLCNPNVNGYINPVVEVKNLNEMLLFINSIAESIEAKDKIAICIDIHSDGHTFTFKDIISQNRADYTEYHPWEKLNDIFTLLNDKYGRNVLVIFVSCFSSAYFSSMQLPHVYVIAAEGKVNSMRARELLTVLYDELCINGNVEKAYNEMIRKYPLDVELKKTDSFKAVLKLF